MTKSAHGIDFDVAQCIQEALDLLHIGSQGSKLVVGVSGGGDSVVLLDVLARLSQSDGAPLAGSQLIVAHVNHGLRPESADEELFVAQIAQKYGAQYELKRVPQGSARGNVEAWARALRYRFFEKLRKKYQADFVLTAHHLRDQAETVLWRILSGRGVNRSGSILRIDLERRLIRPLLGIDKSLIVDYLQAHGLLSVFDSSNQDLARSRNLMRHEFLPKVRDMLNPRIDHSLAEMAGRLTEDEDYLIKEAGRKIAEACAGGSSGLPLDFVLALPVALSWRALLVFAHRGLGVKAERLSYSSLSRFMQVVRNKPAAGCCFHLGGGILGGINSQREIHFVLSGESEGGAKYPLQTLEEESMIRRALKENESQLKEADQLLPETLSIPGVLVRKYKDASSSELKAQCFEFEGSEFQVEDWDTFRLRVKEEFGSPYTSAKAFFDAEQLRNGELTVREWRHGDRVNLWKRGRRKLKKIFQEERVVLTLRERIPIVEVEGQILWVPGLARSNDSPLSPATKEVLMLSYTRRLPS